VSLSTETGNYEAFLDNGTRVIFRRVRPDDKLRLQEALRQLSDESRYRRFFRGVDHFSDSELRYLTELDFHTHFAWVAELPDVFGEPVIGIGRWVRIERDADVAEAAITVGDRYQKLGIGRTLLALMVHSALENRIRMFKAWVLGENRSIFELLRAFGARVDRWESGVAEVVVPLPADSAELEGVLAPLVDPVRDLNPRRL
jgi:hypothetical protein